MTPHLFIGQFFIERSQWLYPTLGNGSKWWTRHSRSLPSWIWHSKWGDATKKEVGKEKKRQFLGCSAYWKGFGVIFPSPLISISFSLFEIKCKKRLISRSTFIHLIGQVPSEGIHIFMKHINICHATLHSYYVFVSCQRCPLLLEYFSIWLCRIWSLEFPTSPMS